jgi:hypothetical protein
MLGAIDDEAPDYTHETTEKFAAVVAKAIAEGFTVVRSDDTHLLLDLDSPAALAQYQRVLPLIEEKYGTAQQIQSWRSRGGNTHVYIELEKPLDLRLRLMLQAALGSDGVKEVLSMVAVDNGVPEPSLLFMPQT